MPTLFIDDEDARDLVYGDDRRDSRITECWEGLTVVPPMKDVDHCFIQGMFCVAVIGDVDRDAGERILPGCNVSDRAEGWEYNYRCPDVVAYLEGNPAVNHETHWQGGPDFLVEVVSRGEDPTAKFDFYAGIGTREVLVVERKPWKLELFRLEGGKLVSAGRSTAEVSALLRSEALPLTFRLVPGAARPTIEMTHTATGQVWTA